MFLGTHFGRRNQEMVEQLSTPSPESEDLYFPTRYSQPFIIQFEACFWKQYKSYWQNPSYNCVRLYMTAIIGILLGLVFWNKGSKL